MLLFMCRLVKSISRFCKRMNLCMTGSFLYNGVCSTKSLPIVVTIQYKHKWPKYKWKSSAEIPKGGPVPPDYKTVAYIPLPKYLDPVKWNQKSLDEKKFVLRYENWQMQKDQRKRITNILYGPLRLRLSCLRYNGFLPLELKQLADNEICALPRPSHPRAVVNRCIITGRPRAVRKQWRVHRVFFRQFADHGQVSGVMRAKW